MNRMLVSTLISLLISFSTSIVKITLSTFLTTSQPLQWTDFCIFEHSVGFFNRFALLTCFSRLVWITFNFHRNLFDADRNLEFFFIYLYKEWAAKTNSSLSTECNCNDYNLNCKKHSEIVIFYGVWIRSPENSILLPNFVRKHKPLTLFRLGFFGQSVTGRGGGGASDPPLYLWNQ